MKWQDSFCDKINTLIRFNSLRVFLALNLWVQADKHFSLIELFQGLSGIELVFSNLLEFPEHPILKWNVMSQIWLLVLGFVIISLDGYVSIFLSPALHNCARLPALGRGMSIRVGSR